MSTVFNMETSVQKKSDRLSGMLLEWYDWSSVKITDSFSEKNPVVARQLCEVSQDAANNIVSHTQAEICSRNSYVSAWYCRTC